MAKIIVESKIKAVADLIVTLAAGLQETSDPELQLSILTDQTEPLKGRVKSPQVRYFSNSPEDLPNALLSLGKNTIIGILYKDIAESTVRARQIGDRGVLETTRSLAERRNFNQKSLERSLVQLRQAGLVDSERIA